MPKLTDILIMVVIVSMVGLGTAFFLQEQAENHGVGIDTSYNATFNNFDEVGNSTENIREKIQSAEIVSVEGVSALFNGAFSILRLVMGIVFLPISIFSSIADILQFPWWFMVGISAILIIVIAFAIANIVFGRGQG